MAHITAGLAMSHVPAIGRAIDTGATADPYWAPLFKGFEFSKTWEAANKPDVVFLVYNDHAKRNVRAVRVPRFQHGRQRD